MKGYTNGTHVCVSPVLRNITYFVYVGIYCTQQCFTYFIDCSGIIAERIRRMKEGNIFSLFTLGRGGYPHLADGGGTPFPGQDRRGYPHPADRGTPSFLTEGGTPFPGRGRVTPFQVRTGEYPIPGQDGGIGVLVNEIVSLFVTEEERKKI